MDENAERKRHTSLEAKAKRKWCLHTVGCAKVILSCTSQNKEYCRNSRDVRIKGKQKNHMRIGKGRRIWNRG